VQLTATQVTAGVGVLLGLAWVWRRGARRAKAARNTGRTGSRLLSLTGRVVFTAGLIVSVQWLVITRPAVTGWAVLAVLGLPALIASHALTRALTMTTVDFPRGWGDRR
jgi:hypothetical protein